MSTIKKAINELLSLEGHGIYSHEAEEGKRLMEHRKCDEELNITSENRIVKNLDGLKAQLIDNNSDDYVKWLLKYYYITEHTQSCTVEELLECEW